MAYISKCKHGKYIAMCDDCYPKTKLQQGWEKGYAEMNKQHKWHKEIKAWADGAEIEARNREGYNNPIAEFAHWWTIKDPRWETHDDIEYRIKPQPKEPQYLYLFQDKSGWLASNTNATGGMGLLCIGKIKLEQDDGN